VNVAIDFLMRSLYSQFWLIDGISKHNVVNSE